MLTYLSLFLPCLFGILFLLTDGSDNNAVVHMGDSEHNDEDSTVGTVWTDTNMHDFVPTSEWQTVKPGQGVPRGLHIRMDMQTGTKEAKLMEDTKDTLETKRMKISELEKAIGEMEDKNPNHLQSHDHTPEQIKEIKDGFRSYDELKKDFESMNLAVKSDSEIMRTLLSQFSMKNCSQDMKNTILQSLDDLVHQIDNAENFVSMGGLSLIKTSLNNSHHHTKVLASSLLGTASQNNPKVKVSVLEAGLLHSLIPLYSSSSTELKKSILFSLSALLRNFPYAQLKFFELGGSEILSSALEDHGPASHTLRIKAATLLSDFASEHQYARISAKGDNELPALKEQYDETKFEDFMRDRSWCSDISSLLSQVDSLNRKESVLKSIGSLRYYCNGSLEGIESLLVKEKQNLLKSVELENDSDTMEYLHDLVEIIDNILHAQSANLNC